MIVKGRNMHDAMMRRSLIDAELLRSTMSGYHPLLDACLSRDPGQVTLTLANCHRGKPDGRFLTGRLLAKPFLEETGLAATDPAIDDAAFGQLISQFWTVTIGPQAESAGRQAVARDFLLAVIRDRVDVQFQLVDKYEDHVLVGLAELLAAWLVYDDQREADS